MSIYSNMQICGTDHKIRVHSHHESDWITIDCKGGTITMQPEHVRALAAALDAYYAALMQEAAQ